jgi:hypothetical protein
MARSWSGVGLAGRAAWCLSTSTTTPVNLDPTPFDHFHAYDLLICTEWCKVDMALYSEEVESAKMADFYPVNSLRNRALTMVATEVWKAI